MQKALLTLAIVTLAAISARAAVLEAFDVSGIASTGVATYGATTIDPLLTSGGSLNTLARTGLTLAAAGNAFSSSGWNITNTFNQANLYIDFSITAAADITLTDLQFAMNGSNTAPRNGVWGYSTNGGTSFVLGDGTGLPGFGTGGNPQIANAAPTTLATWDFTDFNVSAGNSVEFRFWAFGTQGINANGTTASASTGTLRVGNITGNDLVLNGFAAVVPEPATLGLLGLGLAGVVAFARRRKA